QVTVSRPGAGTPTGTVTFAVNGTPLGSPTLNASGVATYSTSALPVGSSNMTAQYNGDSINYNYAPSSSSAITQTVNKANTSASLSANHNPSVFGQAVTLTASVSAVSPGSGTPTGTVSLFDGTTSLGSASLSNGQATFTVSSLSVASPPLPLQHSATPCLTPSTSSTLTQTVNKAVSSAALSADHNPTVFGQAVTLTASVAAASPGAGTPDGSITFLDGSTNL